MEDNMNATVGVIDILIDAINKKYNNIRDLNSLNVNLKEEDYEAMIPVIDSIIDDENNSIGKLQQLIDLLSGSEEDIEEGKQDTIEIIDGNEFVESFNKMKKKLKLSENFDNVIDDVQAVADPVFVGANKEHDENKKKYEDAMEENKKAAEDTIPDEGDTGKEVKSKELKAMHLSESLFEDAEGLNWQYWYSLFDMIVNEYSPDADLVNSKVESLYNIFSFNSGMKEAYRRWCDTENLEESCHKKSLKEDYSSPFGHSTHWLEDELREGVYDFLDTVDEEKQSRDKILARARKYAKSIVLSEFIMDMIIDAFEEEVDKRLNTSSLDESLNESYVSEWWGQVDGDTPQEVAKRYNLKVKPIKKNLDEILYKFEGSLEDFSKAMDDGYFYSLTVQQDAGHSEDINSLLYESIQTKIAKEQIKRFTEGKMPKNWNVNSYLNRLVESKHITKKEAKSLKEWYSKNK